MFSSWMPRHLLILHISGSSVLSAFRMVLLLLTIMMRKKKKTLNANTLRMSLNQIAAFRSLNAWVLWGPARFSQKHEQGVLCTLFFFCLFYRGWYLDEEGIHNLRKNVRFWKNVFGNSVQKPRNYQGSELFKRKEINGKLFDVFCK